MKSRLKAKKKKQIQIHDSFQDWPLLHMDNLGTGHASPSPLFFKIRKKQLQSN